MPGKLKEQSYQGRRTLSQLMNDYERILIIKALQSANFSRQDAAQNLGITKLRLWRRMTALGVDLKILPRTSPGRPRRKYLAPSE